MIYICTCNIDYGFQFTALAVNPLTGYMNTQNNVICTLVSNGFKTLQSDEWVCKGNTPIKSNSHGLCLWSGISCDSNGVILSISYISPQKLIIKNGILSKLGQLTALTALHISCQEGVVCSLGSIPSQLGLLTQLEELDLSNLSLTSSIPSQIGQLSMLTRLALYGNHLTGEVPTSFCSLLPSIIVLDLCDMQSPSASSLQDLAFPLCFESVVNQNNICAGASLQYYSSSLSPTMNPIATSVPSTSTSSPFLSTSFSILIGILVGICVLTLLIGCCCCHCSRTIAPPAPSAPHINMVEVNPEDGPPSYEEATSSVKCRPDTSHTSSM
jgi:hypothetical protein